MALTATLSHPDLHRGGFDRPAWGASLRSLGRGQSRGKVAGELALGAAGVAAGGLALYYLRERTHEEAEHSVLERDGAFSVRRYARLVIAEVQRSGSLIEAMEDGFRPLFDYIAGKRDAREPGAKRRKIAMTVPVVTAPADQAGSWIVRFVMPCGWTPATLPDPANGVALRELDPRTVAAVRFSGRSTDRKLLGDKREELLDWTRRRGLQTLGEPELAVYNAPIVPGPMRRNEWWVEVGSKTGA